MEHAPCELIEIARSCVRSEKEGDWPIIIDQQMMWVLK